MFFKHVSKNTKIGISIHINYNDQSSVSDEYGSYYSLVSYSATKQFKNCPEKIDQQTP